MARGPQSIGSLLRFAWLRAPQSGDSCFHAEWVSLRVWAQCSHCFS